MRFRIAISAGLAAVIVLSVFTMIRLDSRVAADGLEIDELISTGAVPAVAEFSVQQDLITGVDNSEQDESNDLVMTEPAGTGSATAAQAVEPQLEPIYVYPDGSIAPAPSDLLSGSSGAAGYEYEDWDDDHDEYDDDHDDWDDHDDHDDWDDDHDEEWEHDDDDRGFFLGKLAGGLFSERDNDDDDHDRDNDDDDHDRDNDDDDHDRDNDDDDHDRDNDDDDHDRDNDDD